MLYAQNILETILALSYLKLKSIKNGNMLVVCWFAFCGFTAAILEIDKDKKSSLIMIRLNRYKKTKFCIE